MSERATKGEQVWVGLTRNELESLLLQYKDQHLSTADRKLQAALDALATQPVPDSEERDG